MRGKTGCDGAECNKVRPPVYGGGMGVLKQGKLVDVRLEYSLIGNRQGSNTPCLWPNDYAR